LVLLTLGGVINMLLSVSQAYIASDLWAGVALIMSIFLISHVIELPVTLYQTFKIEQQFGFNNTTVSQFIKDQLCVTLGDG